MRAEAEEEEGRETQAPVSFASSPGCASTVQGEATHLLNALLDLVVGRARLAQAGDQLLEPLLLRRPAHVDGGAGGLDVLEGVLRGLRRLLLLRGERPRARG